MGKDARIQEIEIWWPTSNTRQHFKDVPKNEFLEIKEFSNNYTKLERHPYWLGGKNRDATSAAKAVGAPAKGMK